MKPRPHDLARILALCCAVFAWAACGESDSLPAKGAAEISHASGSPSAKSASEAPTKDRFVGSARCAACHVAEAERWAGSDHDRAMEAATAENVLGRFDGRVLRDFDRVWRFTREQGAFVVELSEAGGSPERFVIESTFGIDPLQQYLVSASRGRRQALPVAWDARPEADGGQRWFSLYPDESVPPGDPLHWQGPAYNWNSQCASCHSTFLTRGYDESTDRFDTRAVETDVACEACHGPGRAHVDRVGQDTKEGKPKGPKAGSDFAHAFEPWSEDRWRRRENERVASRVLPRRRDGQPDACAPCHSRRSSLVEPPEPGAAFLDGYAPQLLEAGLYFDDGQIREEVYVWGSFEQSRMFQAGVRCADCHEPHSLALRREGNALCTGCHDSASFDVPDHRGHDELSTRGHDEVSTRGHDEVSTQGHDEGSIGIGCIDCHMPERVFMKVDGRRDHSFPLPSPARSAALGAPDPCRTCHADESADWAETSIAGWRRGRPAIQRWPDRLVARGVARGDAERWLEIAVEATAPPIVRGSAWARYAEEASGAPSLEILRQQLERAGPLEQLGLVRLAHRLDPAVRASLLRPLLDAERRAVRSAAAEALVDVPPDFWRPADRAALARGIREYRAAQESNAERAEAQVNLGLLALRQGDRAGARAAYQKGIDRAEYFVPAHVQLADLERAEGNAAAAVARLEKALALEPSAVWVRYALGLAHYRAGDLPLALVELEAAAKAAPGEPRLGLGWALALDAADRRGRAIEVLSAAVDRGAADGDLRQALVTFLRDEGRRAEALQRARNWLEVDSSDPRAKALVGELGGAAPGAAP